MNHHCEFHEGGKQPCPRPGIYTVPSMDVIPLSIRVCADHRALWVESLRQRQSWPCAIQGCRRAAQVDGLCQHCWIVIRAHDEHVKGQVEPALKRLARNVRRIKPAPMPDAAQVQHAAADAPGLSVVAKALAGKVRVAPPEYAEHLREAVLILDEVVERAEALGRVRVPVKAQPTAQGRMF